MKILTLLALLICPLAFGQGVKQQFGTTNTGPTLTNIVKSLATSTGAGIAKNGPSAAATGTNIVLQGNTFITNSWDHNNVAFWGGTPGNDISVALAAALAVSKNVYIPSGSYFLSVPITVPANTTIHGDNPRATVLQWCGATNVTIFTMGFKAGLNNLKIDGSCGIGFTDLGVALTANESKITECDFIHLGTNISVQAGYSSIKGCLIDQVRTNGYGIVITPGSGSANHIFDNRLALGDGSGILYLTPGIGGDLIVGNTFENGNGTNCFGIVVADGTVQSLSLIGNFFESCVPMKIGTVSGTRSSGPLNLFGNAFAADSGVTIAGITNLVAIGNSFSGGWTNSSVDNLINEQNVYAAAAFVNGASQNIKLQSGLVDSMQYKLQGTFLAFVGNAAIEIGSAAAIDIGFNAGASDVMWIKNGGNIGMGNVSPAAKLDVTGDVRASTTITATNAFMMPTNYAASNFIPVAGMAKMVCSNGIFYKVTQLSTNLMSTIP